MVITVDTFIGLSNLTHLAELSLDRIDFDLTTFTPETIVPIPSLETLELAGISFRTSSAGLAMLRDMNLDTTGIRAISGAFGRIMVASFPHLQVMKLEGASPKYYFKTRFSDFPDLQEVPFLLQRY